jgi:iron complex outermembrane receptor protein
MLRGERRCRLLRTAAVGSLCFVLWNGSALAQEKKYQFELPQQPLSDSLKEYARVSGQQIIFTEDLVLGYVGKPLHGTLTAAEALNQLLQGTGLFVEHTAADAVMIRRERRAGEVPSGPTAGPLAEHGVGDMPEEVVVTGLIYSLQTNLDIKRKAGGLVDVISAEDIGKFPDVDLAAAMQRIPGVTVSRGVSLIGGVPTSIGTATQVTVRGFGPAFNETLFNSRKVASGVGRAFDFSSVGADFVSEIDVMKSPDAALSSGAIGATINIKFPKPLDHPGLRLVGSASGTVSPEEGNVTPNINLLFSDTFAHDTFGILLDGGYAMSRSRGHHVNIQGWQGVTTCGSVAADPSCTGLRPTQFAGTAPAPGTPNWFIQDYGVYQETTTDTRINGRAVLQWQPSESLQITIDDNFSRDTLHATQYGYSVWFNPGSLNNVVQNTSGTITSFVQPNTPTDFQSQINGSILQNNDTGVHLRWDATERLSFDLDYDHSQAWLNPGRRLSSIDADVGYGPSTPGGTNGNNLGIMVPGGHNLPYPTGIGPGGNAAAFINNGLIGSHVLPITAQQRLDRVQQFRAEATWTEGEHFHITAGFQFVGDHDNARNYDDFANNDWQAYAGYGPASNNIGVHGAALPQNLFAGSFSTSDFVNGFGGSANLPPRILAFDPYAVLNYLQGLGNPQTAAIPGFNVGCCNPAFDGVYRLTPVVGAYSQVVENTNAGYVNIVADVKVGDMPLKINAGLRGEYTGVTTIGIGHQPSSLTVQPSDHTAFIVGFGPTSAVNGYNSYQYLLPNLDLTLGVTDELQLRFNASRTLTRPPLNQITPVLNVGTSQRVSSLVANGGNPNLMPYLSDNLDLSAEWYYQPNSYISIDTFNKNVSNFVVQGSTQQPINGVIDPTTGNPAIFTVSTNVNGPTANVYGAEFAVQHVFGASGFGFQANATLVGTNKPYNPLNLTVGGFAVTGLADSANLVMFYDKAGFQARIAANWRDNYLDHFSQAQNNSRFGTEPTFVNANTQVDFSTSYMITPELNVYFSALNLNDATFSTHGRFSEQLLDVVDYGRRFTLGFHFKF